MQEVKELPPYELGVHAGKMYFVTHEEVQTPDFATDEDLFDYNMGYFVGLSKAKYDSKREVQDA